MAGFMELQVWKEGGKWYSRYSAPGYLDCTDTEGPFDSLTAAAVATFEAYGEEGDGDELTPDEQELIKIIGVEAFHDRR
jgi:hypothetical protein